MKVNVITVLNTKNYGSILQTYATKLFWESFGYSVEFMDYIRNDQTNQALKKQRLKNSKYKNPVVLSLIGLMFERNAKKNDRVFRRFLEDNVTLTPKQYHSIEEIKKDIPLADVYCTGSDQMWNSSWNQGIEPSFFLEYAPEGKKRVAFSTSIGKESIDEEEAEIIVPMLKKYSFITVREKSAKNLLEKYGVNAVDILDPTLLVDNNVWKNIMAPRMICKPYILVYRLHPKHAEVNFEKYLQRLAESKHMDIVRISYGRKGKNLKGKNIELPSIEQFLSLVYYADYVVTDSFHGTAFSINFNKRVNVIMPEQFGTRLNNILEITGLEKAIVHKESEIVNDRIFTYDDINRVLDGERKRVRDLFASYIGEQ